MYNAAERIVGTAVDMKEPLMEAGLDSLGALELRRELSTALGVELMPTLVFDYPLIDTMAEHLVGMLTSPLTETLPSQPSNEVAVMSQSPADGTVTISTGVCAVCLVDANEYGLNNQINYAVY